MLYIQVDVTLIDHPKTKKLARVLHVSRPAAVGHLIALWSWAAQYAPDGNLTAYRAEPEAIAEGAQWDGDAAQFVTALIDACIGSGSGFLEDNADGSLRLHDWQEYFGKLIERRHADAERKRATRGEGRRFPDGHRPSTDETPVVRGTSAGHPTDAARKSGVNVAQPNVAQSSVSENSAAQNSAAEPNATPASPAWDAFVAVRGVNLNGADSDQIRDLEDLYGSEEVAQAIYYCNTHKNRSFLTLKYIIAVLNGWQADGTLGQHPYTAASGNGHAPPGATLEVKERTYFVDMPVLGQRIYMLVRPDGTKTELRREPMPGVTA